jgi:hypothetical protein
MGMTDIERALLRGGNVRGSPDPLAVRIPEACRLTGWSRSEFYRRAGRGEVIVVKAGRSSLVLFDSLRAAIESLPRAEIKGT